MKQVTAGYLPVLILWVSVMALAKTSTYLSPVGFSCAQDQAGPIHTYSHHRAHKMRETPSVHRFIIPTSWPICFRYVLASFESGATSGRGPATHVLLRTHAGDGSCQPLRLGRKLDKQLIKKTSCPLKGNQKSHSGISLTGHWIPFMGFKNPNLNRSVTKQLLSLPS